MTVKYIIILIIAGASTLLVTSLEFNTVKGKIKKYILISIFFCIIMSTIISFFINKDENIEKRNQQQLENLRFERNVNKLDSITKILNLEYYKLTSQEKINNLHHNENIVKLYNITEGLKQIVSDGKIQSLIEQDYYAQNFDSLSNVTKKLSSIAQKVEIESYPLVPITFEVKIHFKYNTFPFEKSSMWIKDRQDWIEWFTFHNLSDSIDYANPGFPKFIDKELVLRDFIRNFTLILNLKKDSIICFTYPILKGTKIKPRNGILYNISNNYDDYTIKVTNSNKEHELVFYITYKIKKLYDFENLCNFQSISDFKNSELEVNYEIINPNTQNIYVQGLINLTDTLVSHNNAKPKRVRGKDYLEMLDEALKDTSFHPQGPIKKMYKQDATTTITYTISSKNIMEKFNLDVVEIYLDPNIEISYGKNLSINKKLSLTKNSSSYLLENKWQSNGRYLFK